MQCSSTEGERPCEIDIIALASVFLIYIILMLVHESLLLSVISEL
jgi:hypothetical protein